MPPTVPGGVRSTLTSAPLRRREHSRKQGVLHLSAQFAPPSADSSFSPHDLNSGSMPAVITGLYSNLPTREPVPSVHRLRASIDGPCVPGVLTAVVQPLVNLADMNVVGNEALTRVPASPPGAPD